MDRERTTGTGGTGAEDEETVQEGSLIIEERMNRRDGLVEYDGTTGAEGTTTGQGATSGASQETGLLGGGAMQAGATILGGTGVTPSVDDTTTMSTTTGGSAATAERDALSMSTDNTASGMMTADTVEGGPIAQVREGMRVVDANGDDLGSVTSVKMGDPGAVTIVGEESGGDGGLLGGLFGGGDPNLPESFRNELLRVGYVQIDASGWFGRDRYASADQIAGVSGDTVQLSVDKDALPSD